MSDLSAQKRLASDVLDVGESRVWFDPDAQGDIAEAITREDIRELVDEGTIRAKDAKGNSRGRARERDAKRDYGHQTGAGTRKGKSGGRQQRKEQWEGTIRAQRRKLKELRAEGEITRSQYRDLYDKAKGGEFRSVQYLLNYIESNY
ncbi:50S ribosomal protein L19e [Halorussus halobius]|uniref:50S ribosomal protein L19e n=1 Tax=Halorussus halobius TaxID=1710537 RepID=UPI001092204A|nr:50S ribosomal protein L19e [Halorussus halobius]